MKDKIEIKRSRKSDRSYGRGADNQYIPAKYHIVKNGELVGFLSGTPSRFMGKSTWEVGEFVNGKPRPIRNLFESFSSAKFFAIEHFS